MINFQISKNFYIKIILPLYTITIHMRLLLKWLKLLMVSPEILNEVFKQQSNPHYNLRHTSEFSVNPIHSVYSGTGSTSYLGPKIWEQKHSEIRNKKPLEDFKWEIKKWKLTDCPSRICKIFIPNFILYFTLYYKGGTFSVLYVNFNFIQKFSGSTA